MLGGDAVLRHQEPSRQSLVHFMQPVAGGDLRDLHREQLGIPVQLPRQRGTFWQRGPQGIGFHSEGGGISLNHGSSMAGAKARYQRSARKAFFAAQTAFPPLSR